MWPVVRTEEANELYLMTLNRKSLVAGVGRGRARCRTRNDAETGRGSRVEVAVAGSTSWKSTAGRRTQRQAAAAGRRRRFLSHQLRVLRHDEPVVR